MPGGGVTGHPITVHPQRGPCPVVLDMVRSIATLRPVDVAIAGCGPGGLAAALIPAPCGASGHALRALRPATAGGVASWTTLDRVDGPDAMPDWLDQRYLQAEQMAGVEPRGRSSPRGRESARSADGAHGPHPARAQDRCQDRCRPGLAGFRTVTRAAATDTGGAACAGRGWSRAGARGRRST